MLFLVAAIYALESVTADVMIFEASCIEMLAPELTTAIVASVRSYILRMVASLSASFAH